MASANGDNDAGRMFLAPELFFAQCKKAAKQGLEAAWADHLRNYTQCYSCVQRHIQHEDFTPHVRAGEPGAHEAYCEWRPGRRSKGGCWVQAATTGERVMFGEPFTERAHRPQSPMPDVQSGAGQGNLPDDGWRPTRAPTDGVGGQRVGWGSSLTPRHTTRTDGPHPPSVPSQPERTGRGRGRAFTRPAWAVATAADAPTSRVPPRSEATRATMKIVDRVGYSTRRLEHPPANLTGAALAGPRPTEACDTVDLTHEEVTADADDAPMPATPVWIGGWNQDNWLPTPVRDLIEADWSSILDDCAGVTHLHGQSCRFALTALGEAVNDVDSGCVSCERLAQHPLRTQRVLSAQPRGSLRQLAPKNCLGGDTIKASLGLLAAYLNADTNITVGWITNFGTHSQNSQIRLFRILTKRLPHYLVFPMNHCATGRPRHWTAVVLDTTIGTAEHFDSSGNREYEPEPQRLCCDDDSVVDLSPHLPTSDDMPGGPLPVVVCHT
eukprot:SAG31_NODE_2908_length_4922_cov_5.967655_1_plen_494_part_10